MRKLVRCALIGSVALALNLGSGGTALAHHTPAHTPQLVATDAVVRAVSSARADSPIWTSMVISYSNGNVSFTPPGTATTPSSPAVPWTCTTSSPSLTVFAASCVPAAAAPVGQWTCAIPAVQVAVTGTPADSLSGKAECSGTTATCSATPVAIGTGACEAWGPNYSPVPFECVADYTYALTATSWTVRCMTVDP